MKVAIVHDYLREYGGAERVVEAIHEIWPEAPLYTSFVDWGNLGNPPAGEAGQGYRFRDWDIRTSPVADNWLIRKFHSPLRFLAPLIWNSFDLSGYDVVISSSGWFMCRGVSVKKPAVHICYIHHPPRNLYGYPTGSDLQKYWIVRSYATVVNFFLRHYDFETAQKVDYFIANSEETKRRVWKFYRREATVMYPPIEISQDIPLRTQGDVLRTKAYFLSVGRLTYSKRVDLAIAACNRLKLPLKIVGTGKEEAYLRSIAARPPSAGAEGAAGWRPTTEFLGSVSDEALARLYAGARALIFCGLAEDFGMVPVEAMSHGTPVIALAQGGVVESVIDGKTGILFQKPTVESLVEAIQRLEESKRVRWKESCRRQAKRFSKERFKKALVAYIQTIVDAYRHTH